MGTDYRDEPTIAKSPTSGADLSSSDGQRIVDQFGDYELLGEIARGGMGVVYKARQKSLNRIVALKMILSGSIAGDEEVKRFYSEAGSAAQLEHPNIVPVFEIGEINGQHFFTMGLVDGGSLDSLLKDSPLPSRAAVELMVRIADAIHYAHELGIIHRDLKPANILLASAVRSTSTGSTHNSLTEQRTAKTSTGIENASSVNIEWIPKVSDFGLAKQMNSASDLTGTGQILGTPSYMPPEQANGQSDLIGPPADVYALGAILYRMLAGRPPFQAATPLETIMQLTTQEPIPIRQLIPTLPADLETICMRCLQKDPSRRYPSAKEFELDLRRWLAGDPIQARPISRYERTIRWVRKHPTLSASVGVGIAAILAIVAILYRSNASLAHERDVAFEAQRDAEVQRQFAQSRLSRAIEAVDKMMVRVAGERWAKNPDLSSERKEVLEDAVQFYNTLLSDKGTGAKESAIVRFEAVKAQEQVASALLILNELEEATLACDKGLKLCHELLVDSPENLDYESKKAFFLSLKASIVALKGDTSTALDTMAQSTDLSRQIYKRQPENRKYLSRFMESLASYTYFLLTADSRHRNAGESLLPELLEGARALNVNDQSPMHDRLTLAFALNVQAAYALSAGKVAEAKAGYNEALSITRQLQSVQATNARYADQYLHIHSLSAMNAGLCEMLSGGSEPELAIHVLDEGIEGIRTLIRLYPKTSIYQLQLIQALSAKGSALQILQRYEEGKVVNAEASEVLQKLVQDNPGQPWLAQLTSGNESVQLVEKVRAGDWSTLDREAELLLKTASNRMAVDYNIACGYSIASTLSEANRDRFRQRGIEILKSLIKDGYFDAATQSHAKIDKDLEALHSMPEWKELFGE